MENTSSGLLYNPGNSHAVLANLWDRPKETDAETLKMTHCEMGDGLLGCVSSQARGLEHQADSETAPNPEINTLQAPGPSTPLDSRHCS